MQEHTAAHVSQLRSDACQPKCPGSMQCATRSCLLCTTNHRSVWQGTLQIHHRRSRTDLHAWPADELVRAIIEMDTGFGRHMHGLGLLALRCNSGMEKLPKSQWCWRSTVCIEQLTWMLMLFASDLSMFGLRCSAMVRRNSCNPEQTAEPGGWLAFCHMPTTLQVCKEEDQQGKGKWTGQP